MVGTGKSGVRGQHGLQRGVCRHQRLLDAQLPQAITIIEGMGPELNKGEMLHGMIFWNDGIVIDSDREPISEESLKDREFDHDGPAYAFCYDGIKLVLVKRQK